MCVLAADAAGSGSAAAVLPRAVDSNQNSKSTLTMLLVSTSRAADAGYPAVSWDAPYQVMTHAGCPASHVPAATAVASDAAT